MLRETKVRAQADYVVWRDGIANPRGQPKKNSFRPEKILPAADPGDVKAHRWRKRLCLKADDHTERDEPRVIAAIEEEQLALLDIGGARR
jgi:hypothetical protein